MAFIQKRLARIASALVLAVCCTGCAVQFGRADHDASIRSESDAYVVIGVEPDKASISIFQGWIKNDRFRQNPLWPTASFVGFPEDGFVVTRVDPGTAYAITFVTMYTSKNEILQQPFVPCSGSKTLAFMVPAGKVIYAGSMSYRRTYRGAQPEFRYDFDGASAFIKTHYPKLASSLSASQPQFLPVSGNKCMGE